MQTQNKTLTRAQWIRDCTVQRTSQLSPHTALGKKKKLRKVLGLLPQLAPLRERRVDISWHRSDPAFATHGKTESFQQCCVCVVEGQRSGCNTLLLLHFLFLLALATQTQKKRFQPLPNLLRLLSNPCKHVPANLCAPQGLRVQQMRCECLAASSRVQDALWSLESP